MGTIAERFAAICRSDSTRVLIHSPATGDAWTASDIWNACARFAETLRRSGLEAGDLVVSAAGNHPSIVALILACRELDLALLPLDGGTTVPEIRDLVDRFGAASLLIPDELARDATDFGFAQAVGFERGLTLLTRGSSKHAYVTAVLKLTSGSTGSPRAALTTEAQLVADGLHIVAAMGIQPHDTQLAVIPVSHSYGLSVLVMPLLLQGTAIVLRESFIPPQLSADARRFAARVFPGVPFMFQYFLTNPPAGGWPPMLTQLISAGAPLTPATVRAFHDRFGVKIHSFYGSTETGGIAFDEDDEVHDRVVVGRPMPGVTISLRQEPDIPDGAGRIHVRSDAVSSGYTGSTRDGFDDDGFMTGDYGGWDDAGRLTLLGRVSSFVNVAGRKVQPDEVEHVLRTMPGIADVRVVAAADEQRGQQIVACIVADRQGDGVTVLTVRQFCAARLAAYKVPRTIIFLDAIPLTARGKTDRSALDELVRARLPV